MEHVKLGPCRLEGKHVILKPLSLSYLDELMEAASDLSWLWMPSRLDTTENMVSWISESLEEQERGQSVPFAVEDRNSGKIIGSTRYLDVREKHKGVEIGWTWYAKSVWGTVVNPESKFLLLSHAFDDWGAIRVQLKADHNNQHSQNAIMKLGARYEGRLRNHMIRPDGTLRDTFMYSITRDEWPEVQRNLQERIK